MNSDCVYSRQPNRSNISRKSYLKELRETDQAMNKFLNLDITTEADVLSEQEISLLPSSEGSDGGNIADRSHSTLVKKNCLNSETENSNTGLSNLQTDSELLEDIGSMVENTLAKELTSWAVNNKITRTALNQSLAVLKKYNAGTLPKGSRRLLRTPRNVDAADKCVRNYKYGMEMELVEFSVP